MEKAGEMVMSEQFPYIGAADSFYCAGCGLTMGIGHAASVFRTGFYQVKYPLGCCHSCLESDMNPKKLVNCD